MRRYDEDIGKYITGLLELKLQEMFEDIDTREKIAHPSYTDMEQLDFQILLTDKEKDMKRLFESRKVLATGPAIPAPSAKIIFTEVPYVQYEQILLDKNFKQYLETIMVSKKYYGWELKKHHFKKHTK